MYAKPSAFSLGLLVASLVITGCSYTISGATNQSGLEPLFLCPEFAGVCSWSVDHGWSVVWKADSGVSRDDLLLSGNGDIYVLRQSTPVGGALLVLSDTGRVLAAQDEGVPLSLRAASGFDAGAAVLCAGRTLDQANCSSWITSDLAIRQGVPPVFPSGCFFPRFWNGHAYCVQDLEPFKDPREPRKFVIWEDYHTANSIEHGMTLPSASLIDLHFFNGSTAVLILEDGRVLLVNNWQLADEPVLSNAFRFQELKGRLYVFTGPPFSGESGVHVFDGVKTTTIWEGMEVPLSLAASLDSGLLLQVEDGESGQMRLLKLTTDDSGLAPALAETRTPSTRLLQ
jgi:hypothetical protein